PSLDFRYLFAYAHRPRWRCAVDQKSFDQKALFLKLWEKEAPATRKVLSRIPEDSSYRPDPKSRTAREIAWLIVREEMVLIDGLEKGQLEWEEIPAPVSMQEVLATYDRHRPGLRRRIKAA